MFRNLQFLTILTSKSFSRAGVVQLLPRLTSKSAPNMQRGAFFSQKLLSRAGVVQFLRSSTSKRAPNLPVFNEFNFQIALARRRGANFVDILGSRCSAPPRFSDLTFRAAEATKLWKNTAFRAIPTRQNRSCVAVVLLNIHAARPSGNFQYSRKLELLTFL